RRLRAQGGDHPRDLRADGALALGHPPARLHHQPLPRGGPRRDRPRRPARGDAGLGGRGRGRDHSAALRGRVSAMSLRTKLLRGYMIFVVALAALGAWSALRLRDMGGVSRRIISDNYDSVVAAEDMKESLERQD